MSLSAFLVSYLNTYNNNIQKGVATGMNCVLDVRSCGSVRWIISTPHIASIKLGHGEEVEAFLVTIPSVGGRGKGVGAFLVTIPSVGLS